MKSDHWGKRTWHIVLLITATSFAASQSYTLPSSGRILLHGSAARKIFDQCSRSAPSAKSDLWQPSPKDLDELESLLPKYLEGREKSGKTVPPKTAYHRQYVGFIKNGERYIYGSFYPADKEFSTYETHQAVQVCDGGAVFWGIVYRVGTKTFEDPEFNGIA